MQAVQPNLPTRLSSITDAVVQRMFPLVPLSVIHANRPAIVYALQIAQLNTLPLAMVALATIAAESSSFEPVEEKWSSVNTTRNGQPFDKYDRMRGNRRGDGLLFRGRGYVQLTGRYNYTRLAPIVGQPDLVSNPALALQPDIAASLLAAFLQMKLGAINKALAKGRLDLVRQAVNGGTTGIDRFETAYRAGMAALGQA